MVSHQLRLSLWAICTAIILTGCDARGGAPNSPEGSGAPSPTTATRPSWWRGAISPRSPLMRRATSTRRISKPETSTFTRRSAASSALGPNGTFYGAGGSYVSICTLSGCASELTDPSIKQLETAAVDSDGNIWASYYNQSGAPSLIVWAKLKLQRPRHRADLRG